MNNLLSLFHWHLWPISFNTFNESCIHKQIVNLRFAFSFTNSNFWLCSIVFFSLLFLIIIDFLKRPTFSYLFLWRAFFTCSHFETWMTLFNFIIWLISRRKLLFNWLFFKNLNRICLHFFCRTFSSALRNWVLLNTWLNSWIISYWLFLTLLSFSSSTWNFVSFALNWSLKLIAFCWLIVI